MSLQGKPLADAASPRSTGRVTLICGCMFSGKTTYLLRRVQAMQPGSVSVFKHRIDTRYKRDLVVTHSRESCPAQATTDAQAILEWTPKTCQLVAIDEAHFFDTSIIEVVKNLRGRGVEVILTALDRDSWGRPFPTVDRLCAIATTCRELTTFCARCGGVADRTQRLTPIVDRTMVGGPESYEPRCGDCWNPPPEPPL